MVDDFDMPTPNGPNKEHDVALGDGHWIDWTNYQGARCGGIITHLSEKNESGLCSGAFWTDNRYHVSSGKTGPVWSLSGTEESPTLSPSFLCHCGDHGWVRDGKWVRA